MTVGRRRRRRRRRGAARARWPRPCAASTLLACAPHARRDVAPSSYVDARRGRGAACRRAGARTRARPRSRRPRAGAARSWPIICRSAGRANSSKLTSDDTGLPGQPEHRRARDASPNASGFAGLIATCPAHVRASREPVEHGLHVVVVADRHAAARDHRVAAASTASSSVARRSRASSSRAMPRSTGSHAGSASSASSIGRFESRILPGRERDRSPRSSSPVESTPTRGRGYAGTVADAEAREHAEVRRAEHACPARTPRRRPRGRRRRARTWSPARRRVRDEHAVVAVALGALDHHDRVGAVGHRRAGHDADRLAGADRRPSARARPASSPTTRSRTGAPRPRAGGVGGAHRVAVHRGVGERRDRLGRATTGSASTRPSASRERRRRPASSAVDRAEDRGLDLGERDHADDRSRRARASRTSSTQELARARGRGRPGRARARRWPGGSRSSGRCRSGRR